MDSSSSPLHLGGDPVGAITYEHSYRFDVLGLVGDESEEQMDEKAMEEAKQLGVEVDLSPRLKPSSTRTDSSHPTRRSESIYSTASHSTDLTSNISEASRDRSRPNGKRISRASLSLRDYDIFLARGITDERRTSISFSQPSTASNSTFSLPLYSPEASPKKHFRVRRGLSILRLHRSDASFYRTDGCPHCPPDPISQRRAAHRLPCGHRLCPPALRNTIGNAMANKAGGVPSCCGMPVPGNLVEQFMTPEQHSILLDRLEQWDDAVSIAPSVASQMKDQPPSKRNSAGQRRPSNASKVDSIAPQADSELESIQERPDFKSLRQEQETLRDNFLTWIERQRAELQTTHQKLRADLTTHHQSAEEDLFERHGEAMVEAEDKQVKAEADMRETHAQEKRDHATALKHMEAYCAGTYNSGEAHNRTVTDQDRAELEKARRIRDGMDSKHESAINVLRGEQGRRIRMRQQRQDKEILELKRTQRKEELELERSCTSEMHRLEEFVAEKRRKTQARWELQNLVFAKKVEMETGVVVRAKLSTVEWPPSSTLIAEAGMNGASQRDTLSPLVKIRGIE